MVLPVELQVASRKMLKSNNSKYEGLSTLRGKKFWDKITLKFDEVCIILYQQISGNTVNAIKYSKYCPKGQSTHQQPSPDRRLLWMVGLWWTSPPWIPVVRLWPSQQALQTGGWGSPGVRLGGQLLKIKIGSLRSTVAGNHQVSCLKHLQ